MADFDLKKIFKTVEKDNDDDNGDLIYDKEGNIISFEDIDDSVEYVLLYFSAKYCPPCNKFTPILNIFYEEINEDSKKVEIIFMSEDNKLEEYEEYKKKMEFLHTIFLSKKVKDTKELLGLKGIPYLVVVSKKDSKVISTQGRKDVMTKGTEAIDTWNELRDKEDNSSSKSEEDN